MSHLSDVSSNSIFPDIKPLSSYVNGSVPGFCDCFILSSPKGDVKISFPNKTSVEDSIIFPVVESCNVHLEYDVID